jgi:hypothetical protein
MPGPRTTPAATMAMKTTATPVATAETARVKETKQPMRTTGAKATTAKSEAEHFVTLVR